MVVPKNLLKIYVRIRKPVDYVQIFLYLLENDSLDSNLVKLNVLLDFLGAVTT